MFVNIPPSFFVRPSAVVANRVVQHLSYLRTLGAIGQLLVLLVALYIGIVLKPPMTVLVTSPTITADLRNVKITLYMLNTTAEKRTHIHQLIVPVPAVLIRNMAINPSAKCIAAVKRIRPP